MEMHSVANLATLQIPLATFPYKKAPKPYLVSENHRSCRARSCFPSTRTHISLSLLLSAQFLFSTRTHLSLSLSPRVCSVSVQRTRTHLSLSLSLSLSPSVCSVSVQHAHTHLSLRVCSVSVQRMRTHLFFSLSASAQFLFSMRTHISLSVSAQFLFSACAHLSPLSLLFSASAQFSVQHAPQRPLSLSASASVSVQHVHTHLSLSASDQFSFQRNAHTSLSSLSLSLRVCSVSVQFSLNTDIMLLASLILLAIIAKITAHLLSLPYWYFINQTTARL